MMKSSPAGWLTAFARLGFAARGLVYLLVGGIAIDAALSGGRPSDNQGVMGTMADKPGGQLLLILCAIGFAGYAFWRLTEAAFDPEHRGRTMKGKFDRVGYAFSGVIHIGLALAALRLATRDGSSPNGAPGDETMRDWSAWLMDQPAGLVLLMVAAVMLLATAGAQAIKAYKANFDELGGDVPAPDKVRLLGRAGYAARALVFAMMAWFLSNVVLHRNPEEAGGLGAALRQLRAQDQGPLLLLIVAAGLALFGIFSIVEARYRRLRVVPPHM
ncbi:Membrane protein [Sphingobium herbicidovorans NBRC 16415]|uniref:Membrane protein n=1 Tax=Sphingobium herbicidovorans (strain ATCC 700291 / DSM 11019 / CCUG 56400 / KCTC 2939 / LMG 18315 / NBRC 16415 / MH) TaxID=1219045 RepID=A0A086P6D0_SPHHM|nr:DUF1206 domain-containing protein [Sphingobium herbicidovorans]KFG88948.1 Membrane protein [Sphingobium herbicidovorans NBRC 16415]